MKKTIKHAIAIALLVGFAVLALGSMGSSPSSSSSSSGSSSRNSCSRNYTCSKSAGPNGRHAVCSNTRCSVVFVWGTENLEADCDCRDH
jgi:hypothetical protein